MTHQTEPGAPDLIPEPSEVHRRIGFLSLQLRLTRRLLKLSEQAHQHNPKAATPPKADHPCALKQSAT